MFAKHLSIFAVNVGDEMQNCPQESMFPYVSIATRKRILGFRQRQDACRTLYGELLVRMALMIGEGLDNKSIVFSIDAYGKPSYNERNNLYFNISHSEKWVVCALDNHPVGIDIEKIVPVIAEELEQTCFSAQERQNLQAYSGSDRINQFFSLWTAKESYIKMKGKGMSLPLQSFTIQPGLNGRLELLSSSFDLAPSFFWKYEIDKDFCLTVCAARDAFPSSIQYWTTVDIAAFFSKHRASEKYVT